MNKVKKVKDGWLTPDGKFTHKNYIDCMEALLGLWSEGNLTDEVTHYMPRPSMRAWKKVNNFFFRVLANELEKMKKKEKRKQIKQSKE